MKTIMKVVCGASADMSRMAVGLFGHERPHNPARPMDHLDHVVR
jgi:hypothetical protein